MLARPCATDSHNAPAPTPKISSSVLTRYAIEPLLHRLCGINTEVAKKATVGGLGALGAMAQDKGMA
jgi:hypothetical protein